MRVYSTTTIKCYIHAASVLLAIHSSFAGISPPLSLAMVLTIHLGTETASNYAKNKPPAMVQVAYLADGWNAGLFNLFTETLSLFK